MADLFISYSRQDSQFANRLHDALVAAGKDVWIDWEDIPLTSHWWREIRSGIDGSDSFIFVMSENSMASAVCNLEIAHAIAANKRIIPIVREESSQDAAIEQLRQIEPDNVLQVMLGERHLGNIARQNFTTLGHINWSFFREQDDFEQALKGLIEIIDTDLEHVRQHTRLFVRAREWDESKRLNGFLLTGEELERAEDWLAHSPDKEPPPTQLHQDYIESSRRYHMKMQRRLRIGVATALTMIMLALGFLLRAQRIAVEIQVIQNYTDHLVEGLGVDPLGTQTTAAPQIVLTVTQVVLLTEREPQIESIDEVEMVRVPAGCFWMGSTIEADEQPVHEACFENDFWMDRYEVSNRQFVDFGGVAERATAYAGDDLPRTFVSWMEAAAYCQAQRKGRLPTEAEWEYAARGPYSLVYPWGNKFDGDLVHYAQPDGEPLPVDSRLAGQSWVGALHMSGNIAEWVQDVYARDYTIDTSGTLMGERVYRGGAFATLDTQLLRTTDRSSRSQHPQSSASSFIGFRCVKTADSSGVEGANP